MSKFKVGDLAWDTHRGRQVRILMTEPTVVVEYQDSRQIVHFDCVEAKTRFYATREKLQPLSESEKDKRRPPPPDQLVNALSDKVHKDVGQSRAARSVKVKVPIHMHPETGKLYPGEDPNNPVGRTWPVVKLVEVEVVMPTGPVNDT